jgi:GNAT superfamily N-acetyltransferase
MSSAELPGTSEVEKAFRDAHRALERILPESSYVPEKDMNISDVMSQIWSVLHMAESSAIAQFGPRVSWEAPYDHEFGLMVGGAKPDERTRDFGPVKLDRYVVESPDGGWEGSALQLAARAYMRACGWDFPPDETGLWLLALSPVSGAGPQTGLCSYQGNLVGFIVLYDRDEDGNYDAVGHLWTAAAWRRQGVGRRLLAEARSRFQISTFEEPYTEDGAAFVRSCGI